MPQGPEARPQGSQVQRNPTASKFALRLAGTSGRGTVSARPRNRPRSGAPSQTRMLSTSMPGPLTVRGSAAQPLTTSGPASVSPLSGVSSKSATWGSSPASGAEGAGAVQPKAAVVASKSARSVVRMGNKPRLSGRADGAAPWSTKCNGPPYDRVEQGTNGRVHTGKK